MPVVSLHFSTLLSITSTGGQSWIWISPETGVMVSVITDKWGTLRVSEQSRLRFWILALQYTHYTVCETDI